MFADPLADHAQTALRALRASPVLTGLMVLLLGFGIGAFMTTETVFRVLSVDPIPGKSARLFDVQIDAADLIDYVPGEEPMFQLSRFDAEGLHREAKAQRQTPMTGAHVGVLPDKPGSEAVFVAARYAYADFFPMFNAPLLHGRGWTAQEDTDLARVVVIDRDLATQLFGAPQAALMQTVIVRGERLQVIGVMDRWRVNPFFFDLTMGAYGRKEQFWMPFRTAMELKFGSSGSMNCWGAGPQGGSPRDLQAQCAWLQYWVELPDAAAASAYKTHLERYSEAQRSTGRFQRPVNVRLRDVNEHLSFRRAVPGDVRLQNLLALGFLAVCLVNMAGLLLAKTLRRSGEIGVRRALGATRRTVFAQFLVESGLVGLLGSLLGLVCAGIGLWLVRLGPSSHAQLAQMDLTLLWATLGLGLLASLLAGLLPAWQASRVSPALQLKVQ